MPSYCYLLIAVFLLVFSYIFYGNFIVKLCKLDPNQSLPAKSLADGVDFVELPCWRVFLIQLLNIAGLGPVFGALSGALFGPVALVWIVVGCIFGGAVHDYISAMISLEHQGENLPTTIGRYLGRFAEKALQFLCIALCALVGVVFVMGPSELLASMLPPNVLEWAIVIFIYYFFATILPIQTLIGKLYPFFGALLLFMALSLIVMLFVNGHTMLSSEDFLSGQHPAGIPVWPALFVTIACGAISGFHATQSPMMVRCLPRVKDGKPVFFGAMISEGVIALIWCIVGLSFYPSINELLASMAGGSPSTTVKEVCIKLLGEWGAIVAILGVVLLPITSGDTALRMARLMLAEMFGLEQKKSTHRLLIAVPLFLVCILLTQVDFSIVWRYFGWFNQVIATLTLWAISLYLVEKKSCYWVSFVPALFMTTMCTTYLLWNSLSMGISISTIIGVAVMLVAAIGFLRKATLKSGS